MSALALALVLMAAPPAPRYQLFTYAQDDAVRICRGDTASGVAECVSGTGETVETTGATPSEWPTIANVTVRWLKYPSWFPPGAPGRYTFFTYAVEDDVRVCTGDTRTGRAICADGTATAATSVGAATPRYVTDHRRTITLLRYFDEAPGEVGDYSFAAYQAGGPRVCVMASAHGTAQCASGTTTMARVRGDAAPQWQQVAAPTRWLRFFQTR